MTHQPHARPVQDHTGCHRQPRSNHPPLITRCNAPPVRSPHFRAPATTLRSPSVNHGARPEVVGAYIRFTFFVTGIYPSWSERKTELRPLVESGHIQLANHTWDHPDLTALSASAVASQIERTKTFLHNGVDGSPYCRPTFGYSTPPSTPSQPTTGTQCPPCGTDLSQTPV